MTLAQRLALALLSEGTRVLDLTDNRETHIVAAGFRSRDQRIVVKVWFDHTIHRGTGNGTWRELSNIIVL